MYNEFILHGVNSLIIVQILMYYAVVFIEFRLCTASVQLE